MSESEVIGERATVSNKDESKIAATDTNVQNDTHEASSKTKMDASVEVNNLLEDQDKSANVELKTVAMDVIETEEINSPEAHQTQHSEIKSVCEEPNSNEQKLSADHQMTTSSEPKVGDDSTFGVIQSESISSDVNSEHQQSVTMSNVAANQPKPQIANSIGSLKLLNQYVSSSDEDEDSSSSEDGSSDADGESESDDISDSSNNKVLDTPTTNDKELNTLANNIFNSAVSRGNYREASSDSSETDSDDSDVECIGSIPAQTIDITNDDDIQEFLDTCEDNAPSGHIKAKGELGIEDLPPIEDLTITVQESECVEFGKISGIVDTLVLVESNPGFAAVDIDTVLFLEKGNRTLGQVFDVMGNVASPIYCVRFNSAQDILTKNIKAGIQVYVAPQTEYTNFIVLSDLMKQKGCDASWENDHEAPDECHEFSDDETERLSRRKQNQRQRNRNRTSETSEQLPNKVTVKSEPNTNTNTNTSSNRRGRERRPNFNRSAHPRDRQPARFYKDNRGYSNAHPDSTNLYQDHHRHQQQMPAHQNYSWHTASMQGMPPASTSLHPMSRPPYATNHSLASNLYPNPFAMQANQMNYGPLNLQAFPPLPPPMSSMPPPPPHHPSTNSPYNRKNSNSYQQQ